MPQLSIELFHLITFTFQPESLLETVNIIYSKKDSLRHFSVNLKFVAHLKISKQFFFAL